MPLNITVQETTDRPVIQGGRAASSVLPALIEEVRPLVKDAMELPADKALPVVVPTDQKEDLVRALRAAGEQENVTVRFKRFPRLNGLGETMTKTIGEGEKTREVPVTDPWEPATKRGGSVRVTFWTSKKVQRKSRQTTTAETVEDIAD